MEIRIVTVGKIKEKYLCDGIAEYAKRLSRYCKLTFCKLKLQQARINARLPHRRRNLAYKTAFAELAGAHVDGNSQF